MHSLPLQIINSGYAQNCKDAVVTPPSGKTIHLFKARVLNVSGGAINAAICKKIAAPDWSLYTITAASTPDGADATSTIQAGSDVNIFTTTNNDGYLVGCKYKFNIIGFNISQAESASPVYTIQYYNGSSYSTLTGIAIPTAYTSGTVLVVFQAPVDWAVGSTAAVGGDTTMYNILVRATTAGGQIVKANSMWVCQFIEYLSQLANNTALEFNTPDSNLPLILGGNEQLLPYFGGTANANNAMRAVYSIQS